MKKPIVISMTNHKGGVCKTTSCLSIGEALSKKGKVVLLIDLDIQANLTFSLLGKEAETKDGILSYLDNPSNQAPSNIIQQTSKEGLFVIPNEKRLKGEIQDMNSMMGEGFKSFLRIEKLLEEKIFAEFDFILIDLPPSKDKIVANALMASSFYMIPVEASDYCLEGMEELVGFINETKEYNKKLDLLGIFMPNVDKRLKANKDLISGLKTSLGNSFIDIAIPTNTKISTLPKMGKTIFDLKGASAKGKKEYEDLASEIIRRVSANQKSLDRSL